MADKSSAFAIHPVHGLLYGALKEYVVNNRKDVAPDAVWTGSAKKWLKRLHTVDPNYREILGERMKTFGSPSHEECNAFLKQEGFDIELEEFRGSNPLGGVCTMHVGVEWEFEGEKTRIYLYQEDSDEPKVYEAARLESGISYLKSSKHEHPIVEISTKGPEKVYMTIADKALNGLSLFDRVVAISGSMSKDKRAYWEGVCFPMIDLDVQPDLSPLLGLTLPRTVKGKPAQPYVLEQAIAQVKFKANHLGAQTDAAAAGGIGIASGPQYVELRKPFFVWKTIPDLNYPVLAAYVAEDSWKDPGEFEINNG